MKKMNAEQARKAERLTEKYIKKFGYCETHAKRKANEYLNLAEKMRTRTLYIKYRDQNGKWIKAHATLEGYDKLWDKLSDDLCFRFRNVTAGKKVIVDMQYSVFIVDKK